MSLHSSTCLQNFGGACDCGGDAIPATLRFALCKHDILLSACEGCSLQRNAALEAELAEARHELAQWNSMECKHKVDLAAERAAHERTKAERDAAQADLEAWRTEASLCRDEHGGYESIAARVPLLEAVVQKARGLRWVHPTDRARYEAEFDTALAALDEKGGGA